MHQGGGGNDGVRQAQLAILPQRDGHRGHWLVQQQDGHSLKGGFEPMLLKRGKPVKSKGFNLGDAGGRQIGAIEDRIQGGIGSFCPINEDVAVEQHWQNPRLFPAGQGAILALLTLPCHGI